MDLTPDQHNRLIFGVKRCAIHLELRGGYEQVDDYSDPLRQLARARSFTLNCLAMREAGKSLQRVRLVPVPHNDYTRKQLELHAPLAVARGEELRWLPRPRLPEIVLPLDGNDVWLYDDELGSVAHFDERGRHVREELIRDRDVLRECHRVRDLLWEVAIPDVLYRPRKDFYTWVRDVVDASPQSGERRTRR